MPLRSPMNVIIIGGSIAGLMHGIVLKSLGHHVHVLEAREPEEMEAETAGLSLAAEAQELMKTYVEGAEDYAMSPSSSIQVVGLKGEVLIELPIEFSSITSTWGTVFQRLHHAFLARGTAGGPTKFEFRQRVLDVNEEYDAILVTYHDTTSGTVSTVRAHLVVAADGSNSIVRAQVLPQVEPTFAGYVAWRGYISESAVPEAMRGVFENKIIMTQVKDGYLLAYLTPAISGSLKQGERLLDWIWYDICDVDAEEFKNIMTDKEGRRRRTTVPRGYIQQEVWQKRLGNALEIVGDDWFNIMSETTDPFVTNITDLQSEKACFLGGKLLLVGEAFSQFRPHVGLSSNLAALQALSLARVLKGEQTLAMWETDAIGYAQKLGETSTAFGLYGLSGQHRGWASD